MLTWQKLETDGKFQSVYPCTDKQLSAMESVAVEDGELLQPLVAWNGTLIFGYPYLEILKMHPDLKYSIIEKSFDNWEDAQVWAVEHYISMPEILLAQKLLAAIQCENYWKLKEAAKEAQGTRTDLSSQSEEKSESKAVDAIIAQKVGCGETYVSNFKRIIGSGNKKIFSQCLKGDLSIRAAYAILFTPNQKSKKSKSKLYSNMAIELEIDTVDVLEECEKDGDLRRKGKGRPDRIPVDPKPVVDDIKVSNVADGAIWVALYLKEGQLQVIKRTHDEEKGCCNVKVNCFDCRLVSKSEDKIILEANHIVGGVEVFDSKDDQGFEDDTNRKQEG